MNQIKISFMMRILSVVGLMAGACGHNNTGSADLQDSMNAGEVEKSGISDQKDYLRENQSDITKEGFFKDIEFVETNSIKTFQRSFLENLVKNGDGEFETDSAYAIKFVRNYIFDSSDTIFYIRGQFLPSAVDFHVYGGYNLNDLHCDIFHLPLETSFEFTRYEVDDKYIQIYGEMTDNNSDDKGEVFLFQLSH